MQEDVRGVLQMSFDNVVELPNADDPPPAVTHTWRAIMKQRREIERMEARRAAEEQNLKAFVEQAEHTIRKYDERIRELKERCAEDQNRWVMMTRYLGIDIQEGDGE